MPTWRLKYANDIDKKSNIRKYFIGFKNTDYYNFYNNLINDKKLLAKMQEKGYKGIFVIHPSHLANSIDFKENNTFEVIKSNADYSKIFNYSSLLITDYSSVAFDFTYLNKPVLYTQYDKKDFFENHTYKEGYFSYENNGFGPVIYDYEKTVEEIIKFIENDCKIEKKYQERINKFYKYHDQNNCKRVYEEILKLKD